MFWISMVIPALKLYLAFLFLCLFGKLFRVRRDLQPSGLREGLGSLWERKGRLMICALGFLLTAFLSQMLLALWSPDMLMVFSYEEAARGQNPNATRFNESEILSVQILEKVIRRGDLEMTPEQLLECLSVSTPLDEQELDPSSRSDLKISTEHWVHCNERIALYHTSPKTVLNLLADVYWEDFLKNYAENDSLLDLSLDEADQLEYLDRKDYLRIQANKLRNYLPSYSNESASFRAGEGEETFSSLSGKISHFIDIELERYEAFLLENGLAADRRAYQSRMEYVNQNLQVVRDKDMAARDVRLEAIDMYNAFMSRFVLIPTYDTDREFYMSRTKVGVDYFAEEAKNYLAEATTVLEAMEHNSYTSAQMEASRASAEVYAQAERQSEALKAELLDLASQCRALCDEYVKEKRNGYIQMGFSSPSVTGKAIRSLLYTALFLVAKGGFALLEPACRKSRQRATRATVERWINSKSDLQVVKGGQE